MIQAHRVVRETHVKFWQRAALVLNLDSIHRVRICSRSRLDTGRNPARSSSPLESEPPIGLSLPDEAVVHVVSKGSAVRGTLITNNLVLTAHHCIVERDAKGEILESDLPSSAIEVELGGDYLPWGTVKVRAVVAPACG